MENIIAKYSNLSMLDQKICSLITRAFNPQAVKGLTVNGFRVQGSSQRPQFLVSFLTMCSLWVVLNRNRPQLKSKMIHIN